MLLSQGLNGIHQPATKPPSGELPNMNSGTNVISYFLKENIHMVRRTSIILASTIFALVTLSAFASPQAITGTVTDTMCGKKHMVAGKSDAECTRECMKSKGEWTYGLVVGDKVYSLAGNNQQF